MTDSLPAEDPQIQYRALFEHLDSSFSLYEVLYDDDGTPRDYRILAVNPMYERGVGMRAHEVVGKTLLELHPRTEAIWLDTLRRVAQTGRSERVESFAREVNRYVEITVYVPRPGQLAMLGTDITPRKMAELALDAERRQLAITLRSIGDGVITTDPSGTITLLNQAAEALTGWTNDEAKGRPLADVFRIVNDLTGAPCPDPVARVLAEGEAVELANHTALVRRDGTQILIADTAAPIRDSSGDLRGVVLVFRDITDKQRLAHSLERAQRLESLGALAGGLAHDFNNLLAGLFGHMEIAQNALQGGDVAAARTALDRAFTAYERAASLTKQLLTFAKGGAPVRTQIDLVPLVKKSVRFALAGSSVIPVFRTPDHPVWCRCDPNQIEQVVDNITLNARQAMPTGGRIAVSIDIEPDGRTDPQGAAHPHPLVHIAIEDTGAGIPGDVLPKIFDPFFSTKKMGHGLGLATSYSIVARHDGWLEVESAVGKGTAVHVFLPASGEEDALQADAEDTPAPAASRVRRALVMDDEELIREAAVAMFAHLGVEAHAVADGRQAVTSYERALREGSPFDLVLLDLTVPNAMGGLEAAQAILDLDPDAVIAVSSGYADNDAMVSPERFGIRATLPKPYRRADLAALLERLDQGPPDALQP